MRRKRLRQSVGARGASWFRGDYSALSGLPFNAQAFVKAQSLFTPSDLKNSGIEDGVPIGAVSLRMVAPPNLQKRGWPIWLAAKWLPPSANTSLSKVGDSGASNFRYQLGTNDIVWRGYMNVANAWTGAWVMATGAGWHQNITWNGEDSLIMEVTQVVNHTDFDPQSPGEAYGQETEGKQSAWAVGVGACYTGATSEWPFASDCQGNPLQVEESAFTLTFALHDYSGPAIGLCTPVPTPSPTPSASVTPSSSASPSFSTSPTATPTGSTSPAAPSPTSTVSATPTPGGGGNSPSHNHNHTMPGLTGPFSPWSFLMGGAVGAVLLLGLILCCRCVRGRGSQWSTQNAREWGSTPRSSSNRRGIGARSRAGSSRAADVTKSKRNPMDGDVAALELGTPASGPDKGRLAQRPVLSGGLLDTAPKPAEATSAAVQL